VSLPHGPRYTRAQVKGMRRGGFIYLRRHNDGQAMMDQYRGSSYAQVLVIMMRSIWRG